MTERSSPFSPAARVVGAAALFALLLGFYSVTHKNRTITDTHLNSLQTRALVLHGDVDLARYANNPGRDAQLENRDGRVYSIYGVGISLVAAPIYSVLVRVDASESMLQTAVGASFAAASGVALCLLLLRLVPLAIALGATIAFAFGTAIWPVASMAFFQQGPVVFFVCLGLTGLFSRGRSGPIIAGAGFAAATFVRPTLAISLFVIGVFVFTLGRKAFLRFAAGAAPLLIAMLVANRWIWGTWLEGGYSHTGIGFNSDAPTSFVGLTIGWWRGIFVYSPFLALGVIGWVLALPGIKTDLHRRLCALGVAALATLLFYSKWDDWGGGINQFGYRLQLEIVPHLVVLGAYAVARVPRLRLPAVILAAVSILTMTWGALASPDHWDGVLFASRFGQTSIGRAWAHFVRDPLPGLTLLAGVAFVAAMTCVIGRMLRTKAVPAVESSAGVI